MNHKLLLSTMLCVAFAFFAMDIPVQSPSAPHKQPFALSSSNISSIESDQEFIARTERITIKPSPWKMKQFECDQHRLTLSGKKEFGTNKKLMTLMITNSTHVPGKELYAFQLEGRPVKDIKFSASPDCSKIVFLEQRTHTDRGRVSGRFYQRDNKIEVNLVVIDAINGLLLHKDTGEHKVPDDVSLGPAPSFYVHAWHPEYSAVGIFSDGLLLALVKDAYVERKGYQSTLLIKNLHSNSLIAKVTVSLESFIMNVGFNKQGTKIIVTNDNNDHWIYALPPTAAFKTFKKLSEDTNYLQNNLPLDIITLIKSYSFNGNTQENTTTSQLNPFKL